MTTNHEATESSEIRRRPRRRPRGEQHHREILRAAARLASVEGLDRLSIAALADHVGLSKSGLFAHFGSKEELQLETIAEAKEVFRDEVVDPALAAPAGLARLRALALRFLEHVERGVFPGGCFFAAVAAEVDSRPGPLRDRIAAIQRHWLDLLETSVAEAQERGEIDPAAEPSQVAFEVNSMLAGANLSFLLQGNAAALARGRAGVDVVLAAHAAGA